MRTFGGALLHSLVKARDGQPAGGGIAADFVEGQKAMKAIERGILERLRHHRTSELLNLKAKRRLRAMLWPARPLAIRSSVNASRKKSKIPKSEPNQSARASASAPSMIERSSRLGPDAVT